MKEQRETARERDNRERGVIERGRGTKRRERRWREGDKEECDRRGREMREGGREGGRERD